MPHHIEFDFELTVVGTIKQRLTVWINSRKVWTIKIHDCNVKHVVSLIILGKYVFLKLLILYNIYKIHKLFSKYCRH